MSNAARRAEQKRERRGSILEAAERVFRARGAAHVTMDDIAEAADVSKGTLYLYFKSKDDLFVALTHRPLDEVVVRFDALLEDEAATGAELLRRLIDTHSNVIQSNGTKMRLALGSLCSDYRPSPDTPSVRTYAERIARVRGSYHAAIRRGIADGTLRPDLDPEMVGTALWAAMFGASFVRMNADHFGSMVPESERGRLERVNGDVADLLMRAVVRPRGET